MITDVQDFFTKGCGRCARFDTADCAARVWADGVMLLRAICLGAGLEEAVKWGHPCYMHAGRNIAMIGAFRGDFRLTFMNAALLQDTAGVLEKNGPNTATASVVFFRSADDVQRIEPTIRSYLDALKIHAEAGTKPPKVDRDLALPEELVNALENDPELAEAFHGLTPGRQKSYVINLNSAKQPATRVTRITKFREKIIAGKGALER